MSLDWSNGIGPSFKHLNNFQRTSETFKNLCYFPKEYRISRQYPFLFDPRTFLALQISGVDPNETYMIDILTKNSEYAICAIDFITFERKFLSDIQILNHEVLPKLEETGYTKFQKAIQSFLTSIENAHAEYLQELEKKAQMRKATFEEDFATTFPTQNQGSFMSLHSKYLNILMSFEDAAVNISYLLSTQFSHLLKGRTLIQLFQAPIEWHKQAAKTSRAFLPFFSNSKDKAAQNSLETFANKNESIVKGFDNIPVLQQIAKMFVIKPFEIVAAQRRLIKQGSCIKQCRKKGKEKVLLLFNDILLYTHVKGGYYVKSQYYNLSEIKVLNYEDIQYHGGNQSRHCFAILSAQKSFVIEFESHEQMEEWKSEITEASNFVKENFGDRTKNVLFAPIWIPDDFADACAKCHEAFTQLKRKHHCRGCGKVFCTKCLNFKTFMPDASGNSLVKVCEDCYKRINLL